MPYEEAFDASGIRVCSEEDERPVSTRSTIIGDIIMFFYIVIPVILYLTHITYIIHTNITFFVWMFVPLNYGFNRKPHLLQIFFKKPCYFEDICDYMTPKMKKKLYDNIMKNNQEYEKRKAVLKKVAKVHSIIMTRAINFITAIMLSFVSTYTKHKIMSSHDDFVATWSICLVQLHTLKPIHTYSGKLIMYFLLKHKSFIETDVVQATDIVEIESPQESVDITLYDVRNEIWSIFFKSSR